MRLGLSRVDGRDRHEALIGSPSPLGCVTGELLGLRWSDVDLDIDRALTVRHTLSQATQTLGEPKTDHGRRTLALDDAMVESLREHRRRQLTQRIAVGPRWKDGGYVFASSVGTPLQARNLVRGLPRGPRDGRYPASAISRSQACMRDPAPGAWRGRSANVSKLLGHSSLATTADFYGHLTPKISRRASDRMRAHPRGVGAREVVREVVRPQ